MQYTITVNCLDCGICEAMCARGAIVAAKRQFIIKKSVCNGCAICVPHCPARAIVPRAVGVAGQARGRRVAARTLQPSD
jgi:MinD superfamily P-loop ATPase